MAADVLIYALIAAGLVFWLRSVLGTRTGDERQRPNPFTQAQQSMDKTQPLPVPGAEAEAAAGLLPGYQQQAAETLERNMAVGAGAEAGLAAIAAADRDFSLPHFLRGAQDAFIMIVEAFARADRATLRDLLHPTVYANFDAALQQREAAGETASVEIHAVRRIEVEGAKFDARTAAITVRFVADETSVLRDRDGKLLSGHPDRVTETIDIWTFTRDIRSRDLSWLLTETREGAGDAQAGSTVPDHGITV